MAKFKEITMAGIFQNQAAKLGNKACVSYKKDGVYVDLSWNEMNTKIKNLAYYLLSVGIKKGDNVALFSPNRYEWFVADMAISSIGAVNVPIYATNSSEEALYILQNSESKLCFVGKNDHLDRILKIKSKLPKVKKIVIFEENKSGKKEIVTLTEAYKIGESYKSKDKLEKCITALKASDPATIMYTSGTTGNPKGVILSNNNFVSNAKNILADMAPFFKEDDVFLSFLPLSHSLERTAGYYLPVTIGCRIAYAEDISTLLDNMKEVRPTLLISVPRIYEKVHAGILAKVADSSGVKKAIFNFAVNTARKNLPYVCKDIERKGLFKIRYNLADKLVFKNLKANLGMDRLRYAISGGAPLSVNDAEFFVGMGFKIMEGFGLTETTPVTNYNRPWHIKIGTVGPVLQETICRISDEGEIQFKGPQVMIGYYKNPKATSEVFTKDKFFKTGDIGMIDEDGFLSITGRIKDIIVTAGGKNISPQNIENSLKTSRFIEQIAVIGDRKKYLSAVVVPAFEELKKWAKKSGIQFDSNASLISNESVNKLIAEEIKKYTAEYSRVEQIRKFTLLDAEWTQATGELTPSQKVKRKVLEEKYSKEIEGMYQGDSE